jgi:acyl dehydratase
MGRYFDEFRLGETISTQARTVTEGDIMSFAALTGDDNRIHTNAEFSRNGPFGKRIAHGLLGLSLASGLLWQTGILDGTVIAFREINEWKFVKPVFIDDVVHADLETLETKALPRIGGGSVIVAVELKNQANEVCMRQMDPAGDVAPESCQHGSHERTGLKRRSFPNFSRVAANAERNQPPHTCLMNGNLLFHE